VEMFMAGMDGLKLDGFVGVDCRNVRSQIYW
jgi:hypothetical protein